MERRACKAYGRLCAGSVHRRMHNRNGRDSVVSSMPGFLRTYEDGAVSFERLVAESVSGMAGILYGGPSVRQEMAGRISGEPAGETKSNPGVGLGLPCSGRSGRLTGTAGRLYPAAGYAVYGSRLSFGVGCVQHISLIQRITLKMKAK